MISIAFGIGLILGLLLGLLQLSDEAKAFEAKTAKLREVLVQVLADIDDYERVNNLAPNPGKKDCWQSVTHARAALEETEK
jgi:hypothetical protein